MFIQLSVVNDFLEVLNVLWKDDNPSLVDASSYNEFEYFCHFGYWVK